MTPTTDGTALRTLELGAVPFDGGAMFSVWAPGATTVEVVLEHGGFTVSRALAERAGGTFTGWVPDVVPGARYRFSLDRSPPLPDPASRWQPDGVHGASAFVNPREFIWTDHRWSGILRGDLVVYELHVGAFTPDGTFAGVESRLGDLAALGVTAIELMPIAEAAGARNWGYDGVDLFAPSHHYGTPDDLRRLVNAAHAHGLAVILDVVYNHVGPDGAYLSAYSRQYFSEGKRGKWGDAINLDGEGSVHVRHFFIENALHWIHEYHIDGLRLDAVHALEDDGSPHFLAELRARVSDSSPRPILLIAEDERNFAAVVQPPPAGYGLDAVWADDFHHQMRVALCGDRDSYFADFTGATDDIAETIRRGWFYTGQPTAGGGRPRGTDPGGIEPSRFVVCLQNHDQIGNRAFGDRLHHGGDLAAYRAASALLLLLPQTPLIFMGQEWAASTPFLYFTDHEPELGRLVTQGRRQEFASFEAFADPLTRAQIPDPQDPSTFSMSRLVWPERDLAMHTGVERLYRRLLHLRRHEPGLRGAAPFDVFAADGDTVVLRREPWLLIARLRGAGDVLTGARESDVILTTEDREFCDRGQVPAVDAGAGAIRFHGPAAVLLKER